MSYDSGKFVHSNPPPTSKPPLPRSDVRAIDQWEAEAKENLNELYDSEPRFKLDRQRILALIDLVRKKDEAFKRIKSQDHAIILGGENMRRPGSIAEEALALTDELK
jgi:hypothetical protein